MAYDIEQVQEVANTISFQARAISEGRQMEPLHSAVWRLLGMVEALEAMTAPVEDE